MEYTLSIGLTMPYISGVGLVGILGLNSVSQEQNRIVNNEIHPKFLIRLNMVVKMGGNLAYFWEKCEI